MGKMNLAIADTDVNYVNSLERYILTNYSQRFETYSFTETGLFEAFLNNTPKKIDILLFSPLFIQEPAASWNIGVSVKLADTDTLMKSEGCPAIFKYQHAEKLISGIFNLYSSAGIEYCRPNRNKATIIVAVTSASGGSGKSCIAAACSMLCAKRGLKVFYLSLESISTTRLYFKGNSEYNLSNIIYFLKDKPENLGLKIEAFRCVDDDSKVHFFLPPDSILDLQELSASDIAALLGSIKETSYYDIVFVDTEYGMGLGNRVLSGICDTVVQICCPNSAANVKADILNREMEARKRDCHGNAPEVIIKVLNMQPSGMTAVSTDLEHYQVIINDSQKIRYYDCDSRLLIDEDAGFTASIGCIVDSINKSLMSAGRG